MLFRTVARVGKKKWPITFSKPIHSVFKVLSFDNINLFNVDILVLKLIKMYPLGIATIR